MFHRLAAAGGGGGGLIGFDSHPDASMPADHVAEGSLFCVCVCKKRLLGSVECSMGGIVPEGNRLLSRLASLNCAYVRVCECECECE